MDRDGVCSPSAMARDWRRSLSLPCPVNVTYRAGVPSELEKAHGPPCLFGSFVYAPLKFSVTTSGLFIKQTGTRCDNFYLILL